MYTENKTRTQIKPSLEKLALNLFLHSYQNSNKYRGKRLGQAFYDHFKLGKMTHGPEFNVLYNKDGVEATNLIYSLFDIH